MEPDKKKILSRKAEYLSLSQTHSQHFQRVPQLPDRKLETGFHHNTPMKRHVGRLTKISPSVESQLNTDCNIQTPSIDHELKPHGDKNGEIRWS